MIEIFFSKYSGCGNDFILIDNRDNTFIPEIVKKLCNRNLGIGADGVILLENALSADFRMRIFNSDGSEAEMCGNGLRCFGKFILELGFQKKPYAIQLKNQVLTVDFIGESVSTTLKLESEIKENLLLNTDENQWECFFLNTGVPHAVVFVENLDELKVKDLGKNIRHHPIFSPKGTNANFVKKINENTISIRTFERGVEDETLACGTGASAGAIAASLKWGMQTPIKVIFHSKDSLEINFKKDHNHSFEITQIGQAVKLFHGAFDRQGYL